MAAGLLALLLILPARPARAAAARVELAPLSVPIFGAAAPLSYSASAPLPAPGLAPQLTAAPSIAAPPPLLSAPDPAPSVAAARGRTAAASRRRAAAAPSPKDDQPARARSIVQKTRETAAALEAETPRDSPDLLAGDYAVYRETDLQRAQEAMLAKGDTTYRREVIQAVFSGSGDAQERLIARTAGSGAPGAWSGLISFLYSSLRTAYFADQVQGAHAAVSSRLHESAARFLGRIADDSALPAAARDLARGTAARYLSEDRLLTALAWGRGEKERVAAGRRELAAELAALPQLDEKMKTLAVAASSDERDWLPPGPDAAAPAEGGAGVWRRTSDLNKRSRAFKNQFALFELARERWNASKKMRLSPPGAAREKERWSLAASAFGRALNRHEYVVDYAMNATLLQNFSHLDGGRRGQLLHSPHPSIVLRATAEGYLLQAAFETKIQNPAVAAAFRRSIESYWTQVFEENGKRKRFTTQVSVRILGPDEEFTAGALRLVDGGTQSSAGAQIIRLSREFTFHVPAHEFGHIMGLPDEYVNRYSPETMTVVDEQDRSSLMANQEGVLLTRHLADLIKAMREAGRVAD